MLCNTGQQLSLNTKIVPSFVKLFVGRSKSTDFVTENEDNDE